MLFYSAYNLREIRYAGAPVRVVISTVLAVTCIFTSLVVYAQENCASYIRYESVNTNENFTHNLALLRIVDSSNFEESKKKFGAGIKIPFEGIPLAGFANYDEFDERRSFWYEKLEFSQSTSWSKQFLESSISSDNWRTVQECLRNNFGLHASLDHVTDQYAHLVLTFKPTNDIRSLRGIRISTTNGGVNLLRNLDSIPVGMTPLEFPINREQEFTFRASAVSGLATELIVVPPRIKVNIPELVFSFDRESKGAPLTFLSGKTLSCLGSGIVSGTHQDGTSSSHQVPRGSSVYIHRQHAIVGDNHFSKVAIGGRVIQFNGRDAGFRLHTITLTCHPTVI